MTPTLVANTPHHRLYSPECLVAPTLGVPAYFSPEWQPLDWRRLMRLRPGAIAVINPNSGPADDMAGTYADAIRKLRARGILVYGYLTVDYGARAERDVLADIDRYATGLTVDGLFLDQVPSAWDALETSRAATVQCHANGLRVAANPGQPVLPCEAFDLFDEIVTFEGDYRTYVDAPTPPLEFAGSARIWHLVFGVPMGRAKLVSRLARARGASIAYASELELPNPWGELACDIDRWSVE